MRTVLILCICHLLMGSSEFSTDKAHPHMQTARHRAQSLPASSVKPACSSILRPPNRHRTIKFLEDNTSAVSIIQHWDQHLSGTSNNKSESYATAPIPSTLLSRNNTPREACTDERLSNLPIPGRFPCRVQPERGNQCRRIARMARVAEY